MGKVAKMLFLPCWNLRHNIKWKKIPDTSDVKERCTDPRWASRSKITNLICVNQKFSDQVSFYFGICVSYIAEP